MKCDNLKWNWVYYPYLDAPNKQAESALKAGYVKVVDKDEVDEAIAELKAKLDKVIAERDGNQVCIDALKQKLENVQASAYAESVDAGMRERRLRRALWLSRAERAEAEHAHWATIWFCDTKIVLNINKSSASQYPYKSNTFRNASEWRNMWYDIAVKCRAICGASA